MVKLFSVLRINIPSKGDPTQWVFNYWNPVGYIALLIVAIGYGVYGFCLYFYDSIRHSLAR